MNYFRLLFLVLCLMMISTVGFSHTQLSDSIPSAGETVSDSPDKIELIFPERMTMLDNGIRLIGDSFTQIPLTVDLNQKAVKSVVAMVDKGLEDGTYTVEYNLLSADGHPIQGSYNFSVDAPYSFNWTTILLTAVLAIILQFILRSWQIKRARIN